MLRQATKYKKINNVFRKLALKLKKMYLRSMETAELQEIG